MKAQSGYRVAKVMNVNTWLFQKGKKMKTTTKTGINGKKITEYLPENDQDIKEIQKLEQSSMLDTRHSFGDNSKSQQTLTRKSAHKSTKRCSK